MLNKTYKQHRGFSIVELMVGLALGAFVLGSALFFQGSFTSSKSENTISTNLTLNNTVRELFRNDISIAGAIDVGTSAHYTAYFCKYTRDGDANSCTVPAATENDISADGKYCFSTMTTAKNQDGSIQASLIAFRGMGSQLEYLSAKGPFNQTVAIEDFLQNACKLKYNASANSVGLSNATWSLLNRTSITKLEQFKVCKVKNNPNTDFFAQAPPAACLTPENQFPLCVNGSTGVNALWVHYKFSFASLIPTTGNTNSKGFADTILVPMWNRPCINDTGAAP